MKWALIEDTTMKKIIIILLLMILNFSGCQRNLDIQMGDSMAMINNRNTPFIFLNSLSVFKIDDCYTVVVEKNGVAQKIVEFSSDRKCCAAQGVSLVNDQGIDRFLGKNLNELEKNLGEIHADIGSGFYVPAYITSNGYLIYFEVENDIVYEVAKRDLLTGAIVERLPQ